ncbi:hypothetical protein ACGFI9_24380 [Micromonospora sp. NPDC048930]|uniref:hypothetical protein n=1 Tax=Micromonospora sp. NPDC048930 TaxID=3364261 RepID=UPI003714418B
MGDAERRRRRLRHHGDGGTPDGDGAAGRAGRDEPVGTFADGPSATTSRVHDEPAPRGRRAGPAEEGERGLRGLVGSGSSQVSVTAALRARDAARPADADLAEAEARVVIVRRNWVPRDELPRTGR